MHQFATLEADEPNIVAFGVSHRIQNGLGLINFVTFASRAFVKSRRYSEDFRRLVCMCQAYEEEDVPALRQVLFECQRHVDAIDDWRALANEISALFDNA